MGSVVEGSTAEATDNYQAVITPSMGASPRAVPANGPDVVFRIDLTSNEFAAVIVKAPFQVSLYAAISAPDAGVGSPNDCGLATILGSSGGQVPFASSGGGPIFLIASTTTGRVVTYYVVVDGWTAADKGNFEIAVSRDVFLSSNQVYVNNTQAVTGSVLKGLEGLFQELTPVITGLAAKYTRWDFSESSTRDGFREFITLSSDVAQTVTLTYLIDPTSPGFGGTNPVVMTKSLPAGQRVTVIANDPSTGGAGQNLDFSLRITAASPFQASAVLYSTRDVGLSEPVVGVTGIQGQHN
jgi:hypothetical protein